MLHIAYLKFELFYTLIVSGLKGGVMINILLWLVFGALAGWIASLIVRNEREQGAIGNIVVGLIGALLGGYVMKLVGGTGVSGFNFPSLLIAVVGSVILLLAFHGFQRA
jgi:uncharacterized membrane protein YeaQ/YmgE (transglycosylase-associated protein family)